MDNAILPPAVDGYVYSDGNVLHLLPFELSLARSTTKKTGIFNQCNGETSRLHLLAFSADVLGASQGGLICSVQRMRQKPYLSEASKCLFMHVGSGQFVLRQKQVF